MGTSSRDRRRSNRARARASTSPKGQQHAGSETSSEAEVEVDTVVSILKAPLATPLTPLPPSDQASSSATPAPIKLSELKATPVTKSSVAEDYMLRDETTGLWHPATYVSSSSEGRICVKTSHDEKESTRAIGINEGLLKSASYNWTAVDDKAYKRCEEEQQPLLSFDKFDNLDIKAIGNVSPMRVDDVLGSNMNLGFDMAEFAKDVEFGFDNDLGLSMEEAEKVLSKDTKEEEERKKLNMTTEEALNIVMLTEDLGEGSSDGSDGFPADTFDSKFTAAVEGIMSPGSVCSEDAEDRKIDTARKSPRAVTDAISRSSSPELPFGQLSSLNNSFEGVIDDMRCVVVHNPDGKPLVGPRCVDTGWTILKMDSSGKRMGTVTYKYVSIDGKVFTSRKEANRHSRDRGLRCPPPARVFFARYEAAQRKLASTSTAKMIQKRQLSPENFAAKNPVQGNSSSGVTRTDKKTGKKRTSSLAGLDIITKGPESVLSGDSKPSYEELELGLRNAAKTIKRLRSRIAELKAIDATPSKSGPTEENFYSKFMPIAKVLRKVKRIGFKEGQQSALV